MRERSAEEQPARGEASKILFVCTANICRSPMAEAIFNALSEDQGLDLRAESAGVGALAGEPMADKAVAALREIGIEPAPHRARRVRAGMLDESGLVLAMTPHHADTLRRLSERSAHKVHLLPEYVSDASNGQGVADPYGGSMTAYRSTARLLLEYADRLTGYLKD